MDKQNLFDFLEEHQKSVKKSKAEHVFDPTVQKIRTIYAANYLTVILDEYRGIAVLKYPPHPLARILNPDEDYEPPRFEYTLMDKDFPRRNKIACYEKETSANPEVLEWIEGEDSQPGLTLKRFLSSGKKKYIPEYTSRSVDENKESTEKLLLHGKYHFGSSANI